MDGRQTQTLPLAGGSHLCESLSALVSLDGLSGLTAVAGWIFWVFCTCLSPWGRFGRPWQTQLISARELRNGIIL